MRFQRHQSALVLASVLTVGSFVGATAYTQHRLTSLDALSSTIETNAAPSLEYLGRSGVRLERARLLIRDGLEATGSVSNALNVADAELRVLEQDIHSYLQLTPLPGEGALWTSMRRDLDAAVGLARSVIQARARGDGATAAAMLRTEANPAFDRAAATVHDTLEFDVRTSQLLAREVRDVRARTTRQIILLDSLATAFALAAAFVAFRFSRTHDDLLQRHNDLLEERVTDLDRFAGRVAHDVLSPLDAVGLGIALAARSADTHAQAHLERAQRSLQRVKELVEGLLQFAKAGAGGDAESRCPVDVVLVNVVAECSQRAMEMGVTVILENCDSIEVPCSIGVLTSVIQNLTWNAVKYMGDGPTKRVRVRANRTAGGVQIEVADTGPGIPSDLRRRMFEPFVRGEHAAVGGMGLGLATVKRLVEAHGGTVDVESTVGVGTVFRIHLPIRSQSVTSTAASNSQSPVAHT
jgi:signal transduction histidine kinase